MSFEFPQRKPFVSTPAKQLMTSVTRANNLADVKKCQAKEPVLLQAGFYLFSP
jgi:hypothetical protein